jgi:hypothetical protein
VRSQGDRVWFDLKEGIAGWGIINGIATTELPVLGIGWIVKLEESISVSDISYPFTHIVVYDSMIKDCPAVA